MRFRARVCLTGFLFIAVAGARLALASPQNAATEALTAERREYAEAVKAIDSGRWQQYQQLRPALDDYPLAIYLDYFQLSRQADKVRPAEARRFLARSEDSPLPNRFLTVYLDQAGRDQRWRDFLALMPREPNSIELKCYYFRARLAAGEKSVAWAGAEQLWVYGNSRPKQCDPLFAAWIKAGALSDEAVWARLLAAFDARQRSLMTYVARKASPELRPWADKLLAVYAQPEKMQRQELPGNHPYSGEIASHGLAYLARYNPALALNYWTDYQRKLTFTPAQIHRAEYAIALHSLFAKTDSNLNWLQDTLARLEDDKLIELRLRWALAQQDWTALEQTLPLLSPRQREADVWRYWQALLWEQRGHHQRARTGLDLLAKERSYYGFLAADKLGKTYAFNRQQLTLDTADATKLQQLPAVVRIGELNFHHDYNLAHSEWYKVLQDSADAVRNQQLAQVAAQQGWHRMAIDAATAAEAWDALDLRFPMAYQRTFEQNASAQRVPSTELMAIARRESAFFPQARSSVGAQGLMQIMPATGRHIAAALGRSHSGINLYEVDQNVLLGSAYYRQLLDRFGDNRVFALTAYNAGPSRVERWRSKAGQDGLSPEIWIETIPYKETRDYVQAVLSYNVVFQYLRGKTHSLLTPAEQQSRY